MKIPEYTDINGTPEKIAGHTPLDTFVYLHEPAGVDDERQFRLHLQDAIDWVIEQNEKVIDMTIITKMELALGLGTHIDNAKEIATKLAEKYSTRVEFNFNDKRYGVGYVFKQVPQLVFEDIKEIEK